MSGRALRAADVAERLLGGRSQVYSGADQQIESDRVEEGGCGVTGFACTVPVKGRFIYEPSKQMQNRGNGKGGGIAAAGLVAEQALRGEAMSHDVAGVAIGQFQGQRIARQPIIFK
jgi:hypothetical protein